MYHFQFPLQVCFLILFLREKYTNYLNLWFARSLTETGSSMPVNLACYVERLDAGLRITLSRFLSSTHRSASVPQETSLVPTTGIKIIPALASELLLRFKAWLFIKGPLLTIKLDVLSPSSCKQKGGVATPMGSTREPVYSHVSIMIASKTRQVLILLQMCVSWAKSSLSLPLLPTVAAFHRIMMSQCSAAVPAIGPVQKGSQSPPLVHWFNLRMPDG